MKDETDGELEPTAEELAEAAALARALEKAGPGGAAPRADAPPADALATAALLRHAARVQSPAAAGDARARIAAAAARALPAVDARRSRRRWLIPALAAPVLAVAAAIVLLVSPGQRPAAPLPAPPVALLQTQARAAREGADLVALERQMRDYRNAYYAALVDRERR